MKRLLLETYWWPGLSMQVHDMASQCQGCQFSEKTTPPSPVPAISVPRPSCPWSKVGIDIAGPFANAPTNQKYIVTVIDYASNYPECLLTTDIRSSRIIRWLKEVFSRLGNPDESL